MERRDFLRRTGIVGATATIAGCLGGGDDSVSVPKGDAVNMASEGGSNYFNPVGLHVDPGTTVTFRNRSGTHTATAYEDRVPEGAEAWDSGTLTGDEEFEHTFDVEGTYDYYCLPHRSVGMVGRIVVGSPGGPAEGSQPPDGAVPESARIVEEGKVAADDFDG